VVFGRKRRRVTLRRRATFKIVAFATVVYARRKSRALRAVLAGSGAPLLRFPIESAHSFSGSSKGSAAP
jgi:hypothetical protein